MKEKLRFLGMDVHAETIAVAIAEPDGEVRSLGTIRCGTGRHHLPLRARSGSDGVQRSISGRKLERQAYSKRRHYQVRQRAPQTHHCRISLELSTPASGRSQVAQAPGRAVSRDHRYCMESTEPSAQALHGADGARQRTEKDHDGSGTRIVGLHLGHWDQSRSVLEATNGGMTITKEQKQELSK